MALVALIAFYGTFIAAIVFFCMWLHRTVRNMPALGAPDPRCSPSRAVVFCFIPILNFFNPYWSVLDAWRGADTSRRWIDQSGRRSAGVSGLLAGWWALWLIGGVLSRAAFATTGPVGDVIDIVANTTVIGAAVLCILVVRDVTARQDRKHELIDSGALI